MRLLWLAIHINVSVHKLTYSRFNFLALDEIFALDKELQLNEVIREQILPQISARNEVEHPMKSLSLRGFRFPTSYNPAIIKFIKTRIHLKSLDLSDTQLRQ